jgi:hypothetical protein
VREPGEHFRVRSVVHDDLEFERFVFHRPLWQATEGDGRGAEMSDYARIAHALKRPGIDVISWDTPVRDIDWGGPGTYARVSSAFHLCHRWGIPGAHRG